MTSEGSVVATSRPALGVLAVVGSCVSVIVVAFVFLRQITVLRESTYIHEQLLPLCRTVGGMLDACDEHPDALTAVLRALEHSSPFRNTWITIYSDKGDVWADSLMETHGRKPMSPSSHQREAFELATNSIGSLREKEVGHPVLRRRVGMCALSNSTRDIALAAMKTSSGLILVVQSCGRVDS